MITVLSGENGFALQQELRRIVDGFVAEHGDLALVRLDGEDSTVAQMQEALESVPFLASRKLVVLSSPSAQKEFAERAQDLLADMSDVTDVVVVEPKLDKRSSYYKFLKSHTQFKEFTELDAGRLVGWLSDQAKLQGGSLSTADARYLVERLGAHQQLLANELNKLLAYDAQVSRGSIDMLTEASPQSTIFDLLDAILADRRRDAMRLYEEQRQLRVEPQQLLAMLAWQLHVMSVVVTAGSRSDAEIASTAKLSPYVVKKTRSLTRGKSARDVQQMVAQVLDIDVGSKQGKVDVDQALRNLIVGA
ncbi:DNA polymerase III subunit delta [Candidatus Saccharibacteria bacterium]|nr:DNA polymerase III subunit delta [Candidatus Saccharibacteria bacterium]